MKSSATKMNHPALKGEVSQTNKMLTQRNPRLRRVDVVRGSLYNFTCLTELNLEGGNSSLGLKAEVSLPRM